jgi:hypothetical protein
VFEFQQTAAPTAALGYYRTAPLRESHCVFAKYEIRDCFDQCDVVVGVGVDVVVVAVVVVVVHLVLVQWDYVVYEVQGVNL